MNQENLSKEKVSLSAIEMHPGTKIIFKSYEKGGVPHEILRLNHRFCYVQGERILYLEPGDIIGVYKTPQTATTSGAYRIARLDDSSLKVIDRILQRRFNTSLEKERLSRRPISLKDMYSLSILPETHTAISSRAIETYTSSRQNKTGLVSIIQLTEDITFATGSRKNAPPTSTYQAHKGDFFAVLVSNGVVSLCPISGNDTPLIKKQDKEEQYLCEYKKKSQLKKFVGRYVVPHVEARLKGRQR